MRNLGFILCVVMVALIFYVAIHAYYLQEQEADPKIPGLEQAAEGVRKGLKNPPKFDWNVIRDGKG